MFFYNIKGNSDIDIGTVIFFTSVSGNKKKKKKTTYFLARLLGNNYYEIQNVQKLPLTFSDFKMPLTSPFHLISRVFLSLCSILMLF